MASHPNDLMDITQPEAEALLQASKTVIIPTGSVEQHGPHLPCGTDWIAALVFARAVAERLGALVVPFAPMGITPFHMGLRRHGDAPPRDLRGGHARPRGQRGPARRRARRHPQLARRQQRRHRRRGQPHPPRAGDGGPQGRSLLRGARPLRRRDRRAHPRRRAGGPAGAGLRPRPGPRGACHQPFASRPRPAHRRRAPQPQRAAGAPRRPSDRGDRLVRRAGACDGRQGGPRRRGRGRPHRRRRARGERRHGRAAGRSA